MSNFTDEQKQAVEAPGAVVVSAGAGSGKTYVLTERILRYVQSKGGDISRAAAITFTNKAAAELINRLRGACMDRYRTCDDATEKKDWLDRIRAVSGARLGTFHSFYERIIRENPADAGLDTQLNISDPYDAELLFDRALRRVILEKLRNDDEATAELLIQYGGIDRLYAMLRSIKSAKERYPQMKAELFSPATDSPDEVHDQIAGLCLALLKSGTRTEKIRRAFRLIEEVEPVNTKTVIAQKRLNLLKMEKDLFAAEDWENLDNLLADLKYNVALPGRAKFEGAGDAEESREQYRTGALVLRGLCELHETVSFSNAPELNRLMYRLRNMLLLLFQDVLDAYGEEKANLGLLDFNDLEDTAIDMLSDADRPWIRARYAKALDHIMVDEFQDTNLNQWRIVSAIAGADDEKENCAAAFIVGDEKQSIYRFRGADVSVFRSVLGREKSVSKDLVVCSLSTNFRSLPPILDFINSFFNFLMGTPAGSAREPHEAEFEALHAARSVVEGTRSGAELLLSLQSPTEDAPVPGSPTQQEPIKREPREYEAEMIALEIADILGLKSGRPHDIQVRERDSETGEKKEIVRSTQPGDIAILLISRTPLPHYEAALRKHGIPYNTAQGTGFFNRAEILDLSSLLRTLDNPYDLVSFAGLMRSPFFSLKDTTLFMMKHGRQSDKSDSLRDAWPYWFKRALNAPELSAEHDEIAAVRATLEELRRKAHSIPLGDLIREALDVTGYEAAAAPLPEGDQILANLRKAVELADATEETGIISAGEFADMLLKKREDAVKEHDAPIAEVGPDAVQIMTIHRAKGMEFPIVFVPNLQRSAVFNRDPVLVDPEYGVALKIGSGGDDKDYSGRTPLFNLIELREKARDEAEQKRLFYVAATRAESRLILTAHLTRNKAGNAKGVWLGWLDDWRREITKAVLENVDEITEDDCNLLRVKTFDSLDLEPLVYGEIPLEQLYRSFRRGELSAEETDSADLRSRISRIEPSPSLARTSVTAAASRIVEELIAEKRIVEERPDYSFRFPESEDPLFQRIGSKTLVGNLFHKALEIWDYKEPINELLSRAATLIGFTNAEWRSCIFPRVEEWLKKFLESDLRQRIECAEEAWREAPFIVRTDGMLLEGIIDLLYRDAAGDLHVVDYKTIPVPKSGKIPVRYAKQLEMYADAVQILFDGKPATMEIYFALDALSLRHSPQPEASADI